MVLLNVLRGIICTGAGVQRVSVSAGSKLQLSVVVTGQAFAFCFRDIFQRGFRDSTVRIFVRSLRKSKGLTQWKWWRFCSDPPVLFLPL
jgi:hypothetical protein